MAQIRLRSVAPVALLLIGCGQGVPTRGTSAAERQATLATDSTQARLWRNAPSAAALDMQALRIDSAAVRPANPVVVSERPVPQQPEQPFDQSVDAGLAMVDVPAAETPVTTAARITAVNGEYLTVELGDGRSLRLHVKVGGAALRTQTGDQGQLYFSHNPDPMVAGDRLALRLPEEDLVYALVGSNGPVSLTLPPFRLSAQQVEPIANDTAPVRVTVGGESQVVRHGETATFDNANLVIRVLASIAVQGEAANALPGEPYRIHLLGWRIR